MLKWLGKLLAGRPQPPVDLETRQEALGQEIAHLRREYAALEADMTGIADKLARQLKRIRSRAVGGDEDDDDRDLIPREWR